MTNINISLPDSMTAYVEEIVAKEGYSTISEYFRELVLQDQKRKASDRLETLLLEGLESGSATPMTEEDWQDIRSTVRQMTKDKGQMTNDKLLLIYAQPNQMQNHH